MNGKNLLISTLISVVLMIVVFAPLSVEQDSTYDPWRDLNDDGTINVLDAILLCQVYGTSGEPINKTALQDIYELQERIDSLNASLTKLQDRVSTIEKERNKVKTIRFYDSNEYFWNQYEWTTLASFTWTPENVTENSILSVTYFFEYNASINISTEEVYFNIMIDGWSYPEPFYISYNQIPVPHGYKWSPVLTLQYLAQTIMTVPYGVKPNAPSYELEFRINVRNGYMNIWVRNINIIITVIDGLPASN